MNFPRDVSASGFAVRHGLSTNAYGRAYRNGSALSFEQKVHISNSYLQAKAANHGNRPIITALARQCQVTRGTIVKIERELFTVGRVIEPKEILANRDLPSGPGSISLSDLDAFVILMLYHQEPSMTLKGYRLGLYAYTGTLVCEMTISNFFHRGFEIKGSLCKPNLIPYDKFRPENLDRALDYLQTVAMFDRSRLKFGDEKHLKGSELWCRKTRQNVFTGDVPAVMTRSDFRNTYSIIGFCGIDNRASPVRYGVVQDNNNADNFAVQVQLALSSGFLLPFDVLVLDRAAIHTGGRNTTLEEWLWNNYRIFLLLLPARTPEWNPIELVWNILVQRLRVFSLHLVTRMGGHSLVHAAQVVLDNISHEEVNGCFKKCGY